MTSSRVNTQHSNNRERKRKINDRKKAAVHLNVIRKKKTIILNRHKSQSIRMAVNI